MKQEEKLYSQTELADKIGVSKGTLSKWISKNDVSPETIKGNKKLLGFR
jgi:transcriptional regulator with XRE-family HTH domain